MDKLGKSALIALGVIIVLAFFLRAYKIDKIPPALNWDEISIAYNAYSVLETGKDEWGVFLPVHFKAYGEYKLPVQVYASIPGIALFGLNEFGVRILPIIYGTLTVLFVFFLARALFLSNFVGLGAAFLLAISPWHIQLTRASFESSFAAFWIVLGLWFLLKGFKKNVWFVLSMITFALAIYTYNSARVFVPLFLLTILLIFKDKFLKIPRGVLVSGIVLIILLLPLVPYYLGGEGNSRYKLVSVTDDPGLIPRINENRGKENLPQPLPRLIHNKVTYISFYTIQNYLAHFNPDFLFISGAPHKQHHVQGVGELYLFQAPFLLLGLYSLFKSKNQFKWLLTSWVLLAIVPVSVTNDSIPHALRTAIAIPFYQIITALGGYQIYLWIKKKNLRWQIPVFLITITIVAVSVLLYLQNYFFVYPRLYSKDWQYGYKQAVEYIGQHQDEYDEIVFSRHYGEPHMFTLFYLGYDPSKYQNDPNLVRFETYDWVWVLRFGKYYFPDLGDKGTTFQDIISQNPHKKMLFIGKSGDFPKEWLRLKTINFLNGDIAFEIVEKK